MQSRRRSTLELALLGIVVGSAPPADAGPPATSPAAAAEEGRAAMEALRRALSGPAAPVMALPAFDTPKAEATTQRHAWDAMRRQAGAPAMARRADTAVKLGKAGLATQQEAMSARVGSALGLSPPDIVSLAKVAAPDAHIRWVPLLFVSASMPIDELRTYAAGLEKTGGALAFRGMPGGLHRVAPMAKLSAEILRLDPGCDGPACTMRNVPIVVDPIAFRQHGITRVPALAMVAGDPTQAYCERGDAPAAPTPVIYGDAALSGLLDEAGRLGAREEVKDAQARLGSR
jgi:type-F conjugative transfer system pilin assembly protein TrbC